jgi:hypothetical protein
MKNQKKVEALTLEEKLKNADLKITVKKGGQDFIFLWQEQSEIIRELEMNLNKRFEIAGKPRVIALACKYLLDNIENELGSLEIEEKDGK